MMEMHIASFHLRNADNEFLFLLSCPATVRAVHQDKNESSALLSYEGGGAFYGSVFFDQVYLKITTVHLWDIFLKSYTNSDIIT